MAVKSKTARTDFGRLTKGNYISEIQYYQVLGKGTNGTVLAVKVRNERGLEFMIDRDIIEEGCYSTGQFNEEKKVSRTELAHIITNSGDVVMEINFDKKDGSNRTIICYLLETENLMGRADVADLEENSVRKQVDFRTLHWATIKGIKYTVK